jgi:hypothetical protein
MIGKELIINLEDDKAYLTSEKFLTLEQLDLPNYARCFKFPEVWTIKVLKYFRSEHRIFVEVLSYKNGKLPFSHYQVSEQSEINNIDKITFRTIDTTALLLTIKGKAIKPIIPTIEKIPDRKERPKNNINQHHLKVESNIKTIRDTFSIPLNEVRFKLGHVSFEKRIPQLNKTLEFTLDNQDILEEFDAVKNYFANVLKVKKIRFDVEIEIDSKENISTKTKSPDISRIDNKVIQSVKFEILKSLNKTEKNVEDNKSIKTMDELFDTLTEKKVKANLFYKNENQLFEDLLKISDTKHYKHLRYLSSKHAHSILPLRFVFKPFSFIFLVEGKYKYHIVWETLNTAEATYIWQVEKDLSKLNQALKKIEGIISEIKMQGKLAYVDKKEDGFKRIYHDYSEDIDGFTKWKDELKSLLK